MIRGLEGSAAENISAVTGAIKALSEIAITRDVLATGGGIGDAGDTQRRVARTQPRKPVVTRGQTTRRRWLLTARLNQLLAAGSCG
ncbi:hypothetical protein [Deinococcus hopiensis]|uniref:Uncharacterized protein n=1 Tax=Deinococcus hopiensis KR-140 TaxID=695939 RepID=A0A1W1VB63_9DEIO|nr:hypothetical protein [Deinococcus hopiensis]SMB90598.1 hypothetical protein SAMN00790413_00825 [Deinococcus hopiensis KR-140]